MRHHAAIFADAKYWTKAFERCCCAAICLSVFVAASFPAAARSAEHALAEDLTGQVVDPFAISSGRVVVLLFARTDCPISNRYAPLVQKLSEKFRGKANFWLVYPDTAETPAQIRAHDQEFRYSIPALRDIHHELVKRAQATITPEAAVFDASGKLLYHGRIDNWYEDFGRSRQAATTHELDDAVTAALAGKTVQPDHANAVGCYISDLK
jgi:thiol-disulfide isomerase/thioredoxin